jgi:hypothetical protein
MKEILQGLLYLASIYCVIILCRVQSNDVIVLITHNGWSVSMYTFMFPAIFKPTEMVDSQSPDIAAHSVVVAHAQGLYLRNCSIYTSRLGDGGGNGGRKLK